MKQILFTALALSLLACGCSPDQMRAYLGTSSSQSTPVSVSPAPVSASASAIPPTSQPASKVEIVLEKADPVVAKVGAGATVVQQDAGIASNLGIPGAGWVMIGAGAIGTLAGAYAAARKGNLLQAAQGAITTITTAWHGEGTPGVSPAMATALSTVKQTAPSVKVPTFATPPTV